MNKSILDSGWSMFAAMLEYKQLWKGGFVEYVSAAYTS
nr:IS200/IS605 family element transposase accessory protein TnpB [Mariprofundus aestuarium]